MRYQLARNLLGKKFLAGPISIVAHSPQVNQPPRRLNTWDKLESLAPTKSKSRAARAQLLQIALPIWATRP
jgi:hypothetical protein